ncbi:unnamed protein product [Symbiodinium sp. CCMP2592]|nr:unnamed protein product [Symbiodinium sp. CCMP2592]
MGKGGNRRPKVPECDLEHLQDVLADIVKAECGLHFKGYLGVLKSQAILGADLVEHAHMIKKLSEVQPTLLFRYGDLKMIFGRICNSFPAVRNQFAVHQQGQAPNKLSEALMTLCTHTRRLKDPVRFREASSSLLDWQVLKLEELRTLVRDNVEDKPSSPNKQKPSTPKKTNKQPSTPEKKNKQKPSTPDKKKKKKQKPSTPVKILPEHSDEESIDTQCCLEMDIPATQETDGSDINASDLQQEADALSPVPARKKNLKKRLPAKSMKAMKVMKAVKVTKTMKAMKVCRKPAAALKQCYKDEELFLMPYEKHPNKPVAIRVRGGRQLLQVSAFRSVKENSKHAARLMKKLKGGCTLKEVLEMKKNL